MKTEGFVLGLMGVVSLAGVFFDKVKGYAGGMDYVDLLDQAGLFVMRTAIAAVLTFLLTMGLRYGKRAWRTAKHGGWLAGPNARWHRSAPQVGVAPKTPRLTNDQKLMLMIGQMNGRAKNLTPQPPSQKGRGSDTPSEPMIDIKW
jgi:hypothetical protein